MAGGELALPNVFGIQSQMARPPDARGCLTPLIVSPKVALLFSLLDMQMFPSTIGVDRCSVPCLGGGYSATLTGKGSCSVAASAKGAKSEKCGVRHALLRVESDGVSKVVVQVVW